MLNPELLVNKEEKTLKQSKPIHLRVPVLWSLLFQLLNISLVFMNVLDLLVVDVIFLPLAKKQLVLEVEVSI